VASLEGMKLPSTQASSAVAVALWSAMGAYLGRLVNGERFEHDVAV
jgi:hypothetical protein